MLLNMIPPQCENLVKVASLSISTQVDFSWFFWEHLNASKYAVTGLTETWKLELAPQGIHVCAVHPGVINSDFMERALFRGSDETELESRRQQRVHLTCARAPAFGQFSQVYLWLIFSPKCGSPYRYIGKYEMHPQQMQAALQQSWVSQPEDIAQAIWDAVQFKRSEKVVGATSLATEAYRLFPSLTEWLMEQVLMANK